MKGMKRLFLALAITLILSSSIIAQKSTVVDVPMQFSGTTPVVEVMVNGKGPFPFMIDTGAQGMARADVSLVQRLGLAAIGQSSGSDITGKNPVTLNEVRFDTLSIGSISFQNVPAFSRDYNTAAYYARIDGILGFELFSDYLLTLDYPNRRVRIERGELPKENGRQILKFESKDGVPYIEIHVGNMTAKALIDSGSVRGVILPVALVRQLPLDSYPKVIGKGGSISNEFEFREVRLKDPLRIGIHSYREPTITFAEVLNDVIIGSAALSDFVITFDQKNHRVRFVRGRITREKVRD